MPRAKLTLTPKICSRDGCPVKGEYHSKCRAHKRDGTPCMGQVMTGQLVCRMHGGQEPNAIKAAKLRVAYQRAMSYASRIVAYDGDDPETPTEGLLREVRWSAQVALALGDIVTMTSDDALVHTGAQGAQFNVFVQMWERERMNHARLCRLALDAGIAERQLDVLESQAGAIVNTMISLLTSPRLGLSAEQVIEGRVVAAELLRIGPGPPSC